MNSDRDALIVVDVQNDFLPGGALAVPQGDEVIPVINRLVPAFQTVATTQDWHPPDHCSFASQHPGHAIGDVIECDGLPQVLWPDHCVQDTPGAQFAATLHPDALRHIFQKGVDRNIDSYSGFFDNGHRRSTGLADFLKSRGIDRTFITGLATDYCVKATALDAAQLGFDVFVIRDACRAVNLQAGDEERALEEMQQAGVQIVRSDQVPELLRTRSDA